MELARRHDCEIISVDSMQVYRGMDIGTAKPTKADRTSVLHHLIDIAEPDEEITVAEIQERGRLAIDSSTRSQIICGGSGLHFRSLVDPMSFAPTDVTLREKLEAMEVGELVIELMEVDPQAGDQVDLANKRRVVRALEVARLGAGTPSERARSDEAMRLQRFEAEIPFVGFGLDPGDHLGLRVAERSDRMRNAGLVDEVERLSPRLGRTARSAIGYREVLEALDREPNLDSAFAAIRANTLKLARRQRTWFKRDPRIRWIPWSEDPVEMTEHIEGLLD